MCKTNPAIEAIIQRRCPVSVKVVVRLTTCGWDPKVEHALLNVFGIRMELELGYSPGEILAQFRSCTLGSSECHQEEDQDREAGDREGRGSS